MTTAHASIQAILFDLDDTLSDRAASWMRFIPDLLGRFGGQMAPYDSTALHQMILAADRGGYRPKGEFFAELCDQLPWVRRPSCQDLEAFWREQFAGCTQERDGAVRLVTDLRAAGLRIGVVTNGRTTMQTAKLQRLGLMDRLHVVVISESVGVRKPNREIYEIALQRLSRPTEQVLFVGDDVVRDVVGPAAVGLRTAWLSLGRPWPMDDREPDFQLRRLDDLWLALRDVGK